MLRPTNSCLDISGGRREASKAREGGARVGGWVDGWVWVWVWVNVQGQVGVENGWWQVVGVGVSVGEDVGALGSDSVWWWWWWWQGSEGVCVYQR